MVDGKRLTFGFDGIWQGTAVLYDHQTRSLWMHLTGACFEGALAGRVLARLPTGRHTTWADWRTLHPDTDVLAREERLVGTTSNEGYFPRQGARSGADHVPEYFRTTIQTVDDRLAANALVYGVVVAGKARAYAFERLVRRPVVEETLDDLAITVWFDVVSRSAAAFQRALGDTTYAFERVADAVRDVQTQSTWTMDGRCVAGPLKGAQLTPLHGLMSEWYGWFAHHPKTTLWDVR